MSLFKKNNKSPIAPSYLDRIDELDHVRIIRVKGNIDQSVIPEIEARIKSNRKREGVVIDKNILVDYAKSTKVDSATIAFHLIRLKEFEAKGKKIGFINVSDKLKSMLEMFKQNSEFKIYPSENTALKELNS